MVAQNHVVFLRFLVECSCSDRTDVVACSLLKLRCQYFSRLFGSIKRPIDFSLPFCTSAAPACYTIVRFTTLQSLQNIVFVHILFNVNECQLVVCSHGNVSIAMLICHFHSCRIRLRIDFCCGALSIFFILRLFSRDVILFFPLGRFFGRGGLILRLCFHCWFCLWLLNWWQLHLQRRQDSNCICPFCELPSPELLYRLDF
mmetsp:Transcript_20693/g.33440  ORF Transcript_20693/g.33440 Transcript_20693/m.33440 type:complete len:201 (+) Transcript_20693:391-993(+)